MKNKKNKKHVDTLENFFTQLVNKLVNKISSKHLNGLDRILKKIIRDLR